MIPAEMRPPVIRHDCIGLYPGETCEDGVVWSPCEAEICNDPCQRIGTCKDPRHLKDDDYNAFIRSCMKDKE